MSNELTRGDGPALELRDVEVVYERRGRESVRAVAGASLTVERGQIVGLVGESGCGKSSLARASVGLVRPSAGTVLFEGRDVTPLTRRARPRDLVGLQMVFQNPYSSLNPRRKIGSQLADALDVLDVTPHRDRRTRVEELLDLVGLPSTATARYPHQFSGGQRQRIGIARAVVLEPNFVVLDEPTSALDMLFQAQMVDLLRELQRKRDLTYMFISHDLRVVASLASHLIVMRHGKVVEEGPASELFKNPKTDYTRALFTAAFRLETAPGGATAV